MALVQEHGNGSVTRGELSRAELAWLGLIMTPGMGAIRTWRAMKKIGAAERLFDASLTELESVGMPANSAQFVFNGKALEAAEDEWKRTVDSGARILTPEDEAIRNVCARSTIRRRCCGFAGAGGCCRGRGSRWSGRGIRRLTVRGWRRCCRATWRIGGW